MRKTTNLTVCSDLTCIFFCDCAQLWLIYIAGHGNSDPNPGMDIHPKIWYSSNWGSESR